MKKIIALLSAAVMILSLAACGSKTETTAESTDTETTVGAEAEAEATTEAATGADGEEITTVEGEEETEEETINAEEMTVEEIVALYNESANKIKSTAKVITRNYNKMTNLPQYLELPSAIESLGKWAIEKFVKGSDEAAVFDEKSEIMGYFPVSNENYTSHLTADMVKSADIKETDKTYEITIVLKNDSITSPKKGTGYAGVFNTVNASTFDDISIPGTTFEQVNVNGINGKIVCTMNKETKQITHLTLYNADVLDLSVKVAGAHLKAKMAFSNENDYTIKY